MQPFDEGVTFLIVEGGEGSFDGAATDGKQRFDPGARLG